MSHVSRVWPPGAFALRVVTRQRGQKPMNPDLWMQDDNGEDEEEDEQPKDDEEDEEDDEEDEEEEPLQLLASCVLP
jgi:hypothetical protein